MGIGDWADKGLGALEDGWDSGKKALGEGVEWGAHKLGDGLEYVGADWAADKVEDLGDSVASDLGATVDEQQLGETEQANELIHGDPGDIRASASHLKDFYKAFSKVSGGMRTLDSSHWRGRAADAFRKKFAMHPSKWLHAADACDKAGKALDSYADTVKWAHGQAQDAIDLYRKGKGASDKAVEAYNKRVDAYNNALKADKDPGPRPEPFKDPGAADIKHAREKLGEARRQRNEAGATATRAVKAALAHAPAEPPPLDRLKSEFTDGVQATGTELTHVVGGVVKGTAGLLNFARGLNPEDPYNITHPAAYKQNINLTLAGLASTATHPDRAAKDAYQSFKKDPSEFGGRMLPEMFGSKGLGLAKSGLRAGVEHGMKEAAEAGARRSARRAMGEDPAEHSRTPNSVEHKGTDPVDLATGKMFLPQTDVALPGTLPLVFTRRVESGYHLGRWFGPSWSSTVDQRLEIDSEGVVLVTADGLLLPYPHPAPGVPTLPTHGPRHPLDRVDDGYTITDPVTGRVWHFADRGTDLAVLEQIDDRNGNWLTFEYDAEGTPLGIVHSGGYHLKVTAEGGRVTSLHLAGAGTDGSDEELTRYGYSADGHLTEVTNSSGLPLRFTYDDEGRVTSWTDTNDRSYTYEYDDQDRCVAEGGSEGHMSLRLAYAGPDPETGLRLTTTTTGEGHTRRFLINEAWQVIAETDPLGATTRYERDRYNRLLSQTDPLGHTASYGYDEAGNLVRAVRPDGRESKAQYDDHGLPVKVTGPDGTVHRQTFDERRNRTAVTGPSGQTTRFAYDEAGRLTAVTDPLGHITTVHSDRAGLPVSITDPLGAVTRYERDTFGRPVSITDPLGATTRLEWTVEGRLSRRTAPDGTSESWTYDGEGNCATHTDAMGGLSSYEYTHFDLLTARTGPDGVRYEFAHDHELRLTQVTNPQGLTWSYEYDPAGRLISETDFDDRVLTYAHDTAGRLTSRTNALGQTIAFERNELGQTTRKDAEGRVTTYAYDLADQLAQATAPDATLTLLRDRHGRLRSETVNGRVLTYTYDEQGRLTGRTTPTGATSSWTYDAVGNRSRMTMSGRTIDFAYDPTGRELARHIGDSLTVENAFDELGRLTSQAVAASDTNGHRPIQSRTYTYRADGNLIGIDDQLAGSRRFDVNDAGRVTAVHAANWTESYAYDEAGNQTAASWPADHPGHEATGPRTYTGTRITRAGGVRYEHDALGRVTLRQKARLSHKPDTWRYEWDAEDRLTSAITPDGTRWRYTYDPLGRRTAKLRLAADGEAVVERVDFTWDGTTLCEQTTTSTELPNPVTLTWDHQGLRPIAQTERISAAADAPQSEIDSRFFAIVTDLVGTPSELVDEQGEIAWRTRSTLWGTTAWASDSTTYTPLRFPGQYFDPETGLHYNYFRHYDPETARYLSPDPLGLAPAANTLSYLPNPLAGSDHLGLAPDYPRGEAGNPFDHRSDAEKAAFDAAGVPYGTTPDAEWVVTDVKHLSHMPGYFYSDNAAHLGRFRQFETPDGSRAVIEHTFDKAGPHFHAGQPKGDPSRSGVNFGWDNSPGDFYRYKDSWERYDKIDKPGGDHHFFYKEGWGS
ncbi:putative T7SS-secreted protein [Streptomyces sp. NPDC056721]|uniref:putative T7SS-secreted protein n=1 Tax=unclassified Streptomyces TaxID=2593676 RepID=UPI0036822038